MSQNHGSANRKSKLDEIKIIFFEWIDNTTFHGLPNSSREKNKVLKIVWSLSFLCSSLICSFLVTKFFLSYFKYETVSQINVIHQVPSVFPAISICNLNTFATDYAVSFINHTIHDYNLTNFINNENGRKFTKKELDHFMRMAHFHALLESNLSHKINKISLSLSIDEMLINCVYNGVECTANDFEWYFDSFRFGNCYTFNSGTKRRPFNSSKSGTNHGLNIQLFLGHPTKFHSLYEFSGVHLVVHNQNITPTSSEGLLFYTFSLIYQEKSFRSPFNK